MLYLHQLWKLIPQVVQKVYKGKVKEKLYQEKLVNNHTLSSPYLDFMGYFIPLVFRIFWSGRTSLARREPIATFLWKVEQFSPGIQSNTSEEYNFKPNSRHAQGIELIYSIYFMGMMSDSTSEGVRDSPATSRLQNIVYCVTWDTCLVARDNKLLLKDSFSTQ
ncbi:hypothetical protein PHYBLDRAFT_72721 [Phycomyces blakesleeanus NRRL 1555(-)]|uniref:Uncharacterized protein n=1 Tax=Phycomyces blakesleeanus (strain ATCC 8743b / DSM 1359 / FGSC 10004 / NBRC 33097 / NRRL 1555) TaxID=763407 RepID=A0A167M4Q9_PHYB8|nr:hypothetical protein PHYBLDRAFT_72721 [Phycomyces blakesleeanus NRRL 1555(-)]OAD71794.1 hypothetical protein PHYBLDRAFT_72721 [Phycomyces blakesleeanus NRRL 1555(-)]|eukprot:XP_018289834.1 hypothetical protein PHYBLDRAFT_72721 [Phycomyces blakesleeanus NRRL 1555(-)]